MPLVGLEGLCYHPQGGARMMRRRAWPALVLALLLAAGCVSAPATQSALPKQWGPSKQSGPFAFFVAADMRKYAGPEYRGPGYFLSALDAMRTVGPAAFLLVPGDLDPPHWVFEDVSTTLGGDFPVYPVVGNHDTTKVSMTNLRGLNAGGSRLPNIARKGPPGSEETTYAFEWGDAHVAVLNQYFDGASDTASSSDVGDATFAWLAEDLASVTKPFVFVAGHNPAYVFPDMTSGRVRHEGGGLESNPAHRDRFWNLLKERHVTAYICGHTHNASAKRIDGVWQLDAGHARGKGDRGAPSTFIKITVGDGDAQYEYYRADPEGLTYTVTLFGSLVKQ
jgi:predicted phosphodiesterase